MKKKLNNPCRTCKKSNNCSHEFMNQACDDWELKYSKLGKS